MTWLALLVLFGGSALFIHLCRRAVREDPRQLSRGWVEGQKAIEVRAEGRVFHVFRANGVPVYEDRDESKVRAIAAAVDQARGGDC